MIFEEEESFLHISNATAYNLRCSRIQRALIRKDHDSDFGGEITETDIDDHVSIQSSESEYDFEDVHKTNDEMDVEDITLEERIRASGGKTPSIWRGKNGYTWNTKATQKRADRRSIGQDEIVPGPKDAAKNFNNSFEFWNLLFDEDMRKTIVDHTNDKIEDVCARMMANDELMQTYHHLTDLNEINAFIGILYYAGLWKSNHVNIDELWSKDNGVPFYRCVMPKARFVFLSVCLRFDDKAKRKSDDKLSPIRELWDKFINNCTRYYNPSNWCTVDELLIGFRGRCPFKVSMQSKPDRYGMKIISLNDAKTFYMINAIPYLGKAHVRGKEHIPEHFFQEVTKPIYNTNRSVTCGKRFMSIRLLENMKKEPHNIRITGAIKKNNDEIPIEMKVLSKEVPSTKFAFHDDLMLVLYIPKKHKSILVASSFLNTTEINRKGQPLVISHYEATKYGTDSFDQLCHSYSVSRATRRWPMRYFFAMLDQAQVNSRILHTCKWLDKGRKKISARDHIREIALRLCEPFLRERYYNQSTLRMDIRKGIASILNIYDEDKVSEERQHLEKREFCNFCKPGKEYKTDMLCSSCSRPMCDDHRVFICIDCGGTN